MVKRDGSDSEQLPSPFDNLTARQLEIVRVATRRGFFTRPQQTTANEVADDLGISRSTFLYHLRGAEEKIFEQALDDSSVAGEPDG